MEETRKDEYLGEGISRGSKREVEGDVRYTVRLLEWGKASIEMIFMIRVPL